MGEKEQNTSQHIDIPWFKRWEERIQRPLIQTSLPGWRNWNISRHKKAEVVYMTAPAFSYILWIEGIILLMRS